MVFQGKVEMEMELMVKEEVEQKPCGKGRDEPNQHPTLEPPKWAQLIVIVIVFRHCENCKFVSS